MVLVKFWNRHEIRTLQLVNEYITVVRDISTITFISYGRIPTSIYIVQKKLLLQKSMVDRTIILHTAKKKTEPFIFYFIIIFYCLT